MDEVERTMKHAIEVEENIPMETVTNFDEVRYLCLLNVIRSTYHRTSHKDKCLIYSSWNQYDHMTNKEIKVHRVVQLGLTF